VVIFQTALGEARTYLDCKIETLADIEEREPMLFARPELILTARLKLSWWDIYCY